MGMATDVRVPVEEYLSTSYEPDREYIDGVLVERNVGEHDHSLVQTALGAFFHARRRECKIQVFTEQRVKVCETPKKFRIPDLCLMQTPYRRERVLTAPPLLVVEVLSPDDRWRDVLDKVSDYRGFGVRHIWIVDPSKRQVWTAARESLHQHESDAVLDIPEIGAQVEFREIFEELDPEEPLK
jgi:Uma2 family endonuclease